MFKSAQDGEEFLRFLVRCVDIYGKPLVARYFLVICTELEGDGSATEYGLSRR